MSKKYFIVDEDGKKHSVEEIEEVEKTEDEAPAEEIKPDATKDETPAAIALTDEEIESLKKLLPLAEVADKLVELAKANEEPEVNDEEESEEDLEEEDFEEEVDDSDEEEVVDTDESNGCTAHDSANAIETKQVVNDSVDVQDEISEAWNKRYQGGND